MKKIALVGNNGKGKFMLVDDCDYEYLNTFRWYLDTDGYAMARMTEGSRFLTKAHRAIMGLTDPRIIPDHIDRDKLNNQRSNLRIASFSDNGKNRGKKEGSSSRYKGVTWHKRDKLWQASLCNRGKTMFIGLFKEEGDAAKAYNRKVKEIGNEFYVLNEIR